MKKENKKLAVMDKSSCCKVGSRLQRRIKAIAAISQLSSGTSNAPLESEALETPAPRLLANTRSTNGRLVLNLNTEPSISAAVRRQMLAARKHKKNCSIIVMEALTTLLLVLGPAAASWEPLTKGLDESDVRKVAVEPGDGPTVWAATARNLYRLSAPHLGFQQVFSESSGAGSINDFFLDAESPGHVYVAATDGVYQIDRNNFRWEKIFSGSAEEGKQAFCVRKVGNKLFVGTNSGILYRTCAGMGAWQKVEGALGSAPVYKLEEDAENMYALTDKNLYRQAKTSSEAKAIFTASGGEAEAGEGQVGGIGRGLRDVIIGRVGGQGNQIFLATESGIFTSVDQGDNWQRLSVNGLAFSQVNGLAFCPGGENTTDVAAETITSEGGSLLAATGQGVFQLAGQAWTPVYQGMDATSVSSLACSARVICAATNAGVYQGVIPLTGRDGYLSVSENSSPVGVDKKNVASQAFFNELTVQEVQRLAIRYADVSPNKTKEWVHLAKRKAFLPTLSVGIDRNTSNIYHWDSGASPDQLIKGRDLKDWDVSLSWNLSDLIWNNDVASIDSRAKLTSELRADILAQVTRLYFERRRLQIELAKEMSDTSIKLEQELRVQELTALIDGFTDGEFSRHIQSYPHGTSGKKYDVILPVGEQEQNKKLKGES